MKTKMLCAAAGIIFFSSFAAAEFDFDIPADISITKKIYDTEIETSSTAPGRDESAAEKNTVADERAPEYKNARAELVLCNPYKDSYCSETEVYGEGYGLIRIEGKTYPVRPGGKNQTEASVMNGTLMAFIAIEHRAHRELWIYDSTPFLATGYIGRTEYGNKKVFYLTGMQDLAEDSKGASYQNIKAELRLCNPYRYSYCSETQFYGEGYGLIRIKGETYPIRPAGKNQTEASIVNGTLMAFIAMENRAHRDEKFYDSKSFLATGYVGKSEYGNKKVFYLTGFRDLMIK